MKSSLSLTLLTALITGAAVPAAQAQSAGDMMVRLRAVNIDPANSDTVVIGGTDVAVDLNSKAFPEVDFTYFATPNLALELVLTYPQKHDVSIDGVKAGSLKHLPPTLTLQYHFTDLGPARPYLGAGLNYTRFSSVNLPAGLGIENNSVGWAVQGGVDYLLDNRWSLNFDFKKLQIRTDLSSGGVNHGTLKIDPYLLGIGVGYKF
jgi:outer membrane protein